MNGIEIHRTKPATLDDIARESGYHRTTVSQVLNGHENCWASEQTREKIFATAAALDYRPNLSARALRTGRTHLIGFVSPGFGSQSTHSRTVGLTDTAAAHDYTVILSSHPNTPESENLVIRRLINRGVDGLAVYPVDPGPHRALRELVDQGFPVVTFDGRHILDFESDDLSVDYAEVGRLQTRHLLDIGRRRFCLANTQPEARVNAIREAAIRQELKRAGAPPPLEMRIERPASREIVDADPLEGHFHAFFRKHSGVFDAVIGFDAMASLAMQALRRLGVRIPEEVAVVGSGDSILAGYGAIPLTSIGTADDDAGAKAFDVLMNRIRNRKKTPFQRITTPARIIKRESTRPTINRG